MEDLTTIQLEAIQVLIETEETINYGINLICSRFSHNQEDRNDLLRALRSLSDISIKYSSLKSTHERYLKDDEGNT